MSRPMIPLSHFEHLIKLYENRSAWHDWSSNWEKCDKTIKEFADFVRETAEEK